MIFAGYSVAILGAYLLGSIPTGFLVGKARGLDVRTLGSGNIGATNVFRILGRPAGFLVLFIDALKGFLACTLVARLAATLAGAPADEALRQNLSITAGLCAVLGHNFTCWLRFKGGKGIATSAGVLLAWIPLGLLIVLATWLVVFFLSKYVSLASVLAAAVLPFGVWFTRSDTVYIWITAMLSALAIYKHKANIQRLLNGTEHRFGRKKQPPAPAA